jgi:DNA-directed RNA polymerase subunit RPC12/RpoP
MTSETKTFIEFEDILGVQMECLRCGAKATRPLGKIQRYPVRCENCNEEWFIGSSEQAKEKLYHTLDELAEIQKWVQALPGSEIQLKLRLELASQKEEKA